MQGAQERRRQRRLPFVQVNARVRVRRSLFTREWVDVRVHDFSIKGIAFTGDLPLQEGEKLHLSLQLQTETGDFAIERVVAIIRNSPRINDRTTFGAEFTRDNSVHVQHCLAQIEGILNRYHELTSRISQHKSQAGGG